MQTDAQINFYPDSLASLDHDLSHQSFELLQKNHTQVNLKDELPTITEERRSSIGNSNADGYDSLPKLGLNLNHDNAVNHND